MTTYTDEGFAPFDLLDIFYTYERVRRWAGTNGRKAEPNGSLFAPLCTRPFVKAAFVISAMARYTEPLHYQLTKCSLAEVTQRLEICQNGLKSAILTINEEPITMPGPAAIPIVLSQAQQETLEQIVRCQTSEQRLVRRAQILLKANAGLNNEQIAQALSINRETVQRWRQRWSEAAEAFAMEEVQEITAKALRQRIHSILMDHSRTGTPPKFTSQQVVRIVALACEDPQEAGVPVTEWTPRELAQKAIKRGIVESISARSVERFLKGG